MPFSSAHHLSCKSGLVKGEVRRICRRTQCVKTRALHLEFFAQKLQDRGYPMCFVRQIFNSMASTIANPSREEAGRPRRLHLRGRHFMRVACRKDIDEMWLRKTPRQL